MIKEKYESDLVENDGRLFYKTKDYYNWLGKVLYQRRMKMNPLWNGIIMAGKDNNEVFLG